MALIRRLQQRAEGFRTFRPSQPEHVREERADPPSRPEPEEESHPEDYFTRKVWLTDSAPDDMRGGTEYLHATSLIGMCERREVLASLAGASAVSTRQVMGALRIVWALGRAAENHVRDQFVKAEQRRGIHARWVCRCGQTEQEGLWEQLTCPVCDQPVDRFRELALWDHDAKIVGNPDLMYDLPHSGNRRVVEIKSIAGQAYKELVAPVPDHVLQAHLYRRMLIGGDVVPDESVSVVYVSKEFTPRPYKEFTVPITREISETLDGLWERAYRIKEWKQARAEGRRPPLPPRLEACSRPDTGKAKGCDQCSACFSREE